MTFTQFLLITGVLAVVVFFSSQLQKFCVFVLTKIGDTIGVRSQKSEYYLQRYIFMHSNGIVAGAYKWVNSQVICLGLKRYGVTCVGYLTFWVLVALPVAIAVGVFANLNAFLYFVVYIAVLFAILFLTRMRTVSQLEDREAIIMDTIDLLVPNLKDGVLMTIERYKGNIHESLRTDFLMFLDRINNKGYTFEESMIILSDSIGGDVFRDFAQKAIFYEPIGDKETVSIFSQCIELNRMRRTIREKNRKIFDEKKKDFILSSACVWGYAIFVGLQEEYTYNFIINTDFGNFLLILDFIIEIVVLGCITSIRAKEL